jgi:hypothetical protein
MSPAGREVEFYEMNGTQHFLEALLIAAIRPAPLASVPMASEVQPASSPGMSAQDATRRGLRSAPRHWNGAPGRCCEVRLAGFSAIGSLQCGTLCVPGLPGGRTTRGVEEGIPTGTVGSNARTGAGVPRGVSIRHGRASIARAGAARFVWLDFR